MLQFVFADKKHIDLYYNWANDQAVRLNSYNSQPIDYEAHCSWFLNNLIDKNNFFYLFQNEYKEFVGQVRIEMNKPEKGNALIGLSIDVNFRGQGLANQIIKLASEDFLQKFPHYIIIAYVLEGNISSFKAFIKAGFSKIDNINIQGKASYVLNKSI